MPKKIRKQSSKKRRTKRQKYMKHKRSAKVRNALAKGTDSGMHCCMCNKQIRMVEGLIPAQCLRKNGAIRAHRICQECWFDPRKGFAREGVDHSCPGCVKGLPLNGPPIETGIIDLTSD